MTFAHTGIPILIYHRVSADGGIDKFSHLLAIEESKFAAQMQCLVDKGFQTLTVADLLAIRNGSGTAPERGVVISFDDGYENMYMRALPILKKYGLKATFFIITGLVGAKGYLSWEQLLEMKSAGMNLESHTHTHPALTKLSREKIREELVTSKEILEERLQSEITTLCVPGGFTNAVVSATAQECGYRAICTSLQGLNRIDNASFELRRIGIKGFDSISRFDDLVHGRIVTIYGYRLRQMVLLGMRKALGVENYERIKASLLS